MAIISLDLARSYFRNEQFVDAADEQRLQRAIDTAQRTLERITDRRFESDGQVTETIAAYDGYLYPRTLPLTGVTSVALDGQDVEHAIDGDTVFIPSASRYAFYPFHYYRPDRYTITYTGGYTVTGEGRNVPADLADIMGSLTRLFLDVEHSITRADAGFGNESAARNRNRYSKGGIPVYLYNRARHFKRRKGRVYNGI